MKRKFWMARNYYMWLYRWSTPLLPGTMWSSSTKRPHQQPFHTSRNKRVPTWHAEVRAPSGQTNQQRSLTMRSHHTMTQKDLIKGAADWSPASHSLTRVAGKHQDDKVPLNLTILPHTSQLYFSPQTESFPVIFSPRLHHYTQALQHPYNGPYGVLRRHDK